MTSGRDRLTHNNGVAIVNRKIGDNALKFVGEVVLPGAAQLMAGNLKSGITHAVLGISAGALLVGTGVAPVLGTLAVIGIRLNSYASSLTGDAPPMITPLAGLEPGAQTPPALGSGAEPVAGGNDQTAAGGAGQALARAVPTEAPAREPRARRASPAAIPDPDAPSGA
jgi:hypothetical protein